MRKKATVLGKTLLCCVLGFVIAGCSPTSILNATIPTRGYTVHRDIAYGTDPRQKLDIYVPDTLDRNRPAPVLLFFYGGSWQYGSKDDYLFVGQALASKGFVTVVADYRLYPQVYYPAFVEDGAQALAWTHKHIGQYGGNTDKLFLTGHSAGAYIAVMLTVNHSFLEQAGVPKQALRGAIGIAGPYDFLPLQDEDLIALFSKAKIEETQPVNFVDGGNAPMLLATGDEDETVIPRNTERLSAKLEEYNGPHETRIYKGVAHIGIILSLAEGFRSKTTLLEDIARFVNQRSEAGHSR